MKHLSLRIAFSKLEPEAQQELTARLSKGFRLGFWEVVPDEEALRLRRPPGPGVAFGHYLQTNFVLKNTGLYSGQSCVGSEWFTQPELTEGPKSGTEIIQCNDETPRHAHFMFDGQMTSLFQNYLSTSIH